MENNFCIDMAKTLYMPKRPEWFHSVVSKYTNCKLPAFFAFAKDKEQEQLQSRNASFVNKIYDRIPDKPINTAKMDLEKLHYQTLMQNSNMVCSREVSDLYDKLNKQYRYMVNMKDEHIDNLRYIACEIRESFRKSGYSAETITDMLVEYLYGRKKRYKQLLWFCYGQQVFNNLEKNIEYRKLKVIQCKDCGEWFEVPISSKRIRCDACHQLERREHNRKMYQNRKIKPS